MCVFVWTFWQVKKQTFSICNQVIFSLDLVVIIDKWIVVKRSEGRSKRRWSGSLLKMDAVFCRESLDLHFIFHFRYGFRYVPVYLTRVYICVLCSNCSVVFHNNSLQNVADSFSHLKLNCIPCLSIWIRYLFNVSSSPDFCWFFEKIEEQTKLKFDIRDFLFGFVSDLKNRMKKFIWNRHRWVIIRMCNATPKYKIQKQKQKYGPNHQ